MKLNGRANPARSSNAAMSLCCSECRWTGHTWMSGPHALISMVCSRRPGMNDTNPETEPVLKARFAAMTGSERARSPSCCVRIG